MPAHTNIRKIKADLPDHRSILQFRNMDKPCMVITADKAKMDAQNFRKAAGLLQDKQLADWLNDLAGKFERLEPDNGSKG